MEKIKNGIMVGLVTVTRVLCSKQRRGVQRRRRQEAKKTQEWELWEFG